MKPPVEAPASRQRRPATTRPAGSNAASAPASLWPPRETYSSPPGIAGSAATTSATSVVTAGRGLGGRRSRHRHAAVGDQLRGMVARARQPSADELGVEPEATRRHRSRPARPVSASTGRRGGPQRVVGPLERREVLLERRVVEPVDVGEHVVHGRHPGRGRLHRRRPPALSTSSVVRLVELRVGGTCSVMAAGYPDAVGRPGAVRPDTSAGVRRSPSRWSQPGRRHRGPPGVGVLRLLPVALDDQPSTVDAGRPRPARHRLPSLDAAQPGRPSAVRSCPTQVGRWSGRGGHQVGQRRSRRSSPAASRSRPRARPRCRCAGCRRPSAAGRPPTRRRVSSNSGRSGLPATSGVTPAKSLISRHERAVAGRRTRRRWAASGRCSWPPTGSPFLIAIAARMIVCHADLGRVARDDRHRARASPTGTGSSPASRSASDEARPPPARRSGRPAPCASRSSRAAAWDEVTTSLEVGVDTELAEVLGHLLGGPGGVVGDERDVRAARRGQSAMLSAAWSTAWPST